MRVDGVGKEKTHDQGDPEICCGRVHAFRSCGAVVNEWVDAGSDADCNDLRDTGERGDEHDDAGERRCSDGPDAGAMHGNDGNDDDYDGQRRYVDDARYSRAAYGPSRRDSHAEHRRAPVNRKVSRLADRRKDNVMLKMCFDKRVVGGLILFGLAMFMFAPNVFAAALPWLFIVACPLSMLLMAKTAKGGSTVTPISQNVHPEIVIPKVGSRHGDVTTTESGRCPTCGAAIGMNHSPMNSFSPAASYGHPRAPFPTSR